MLLARAATIYNYALDATKTEDTIVTEVVMYIIIQVFEKYNSNGCFSFGKSSLTMKTGLLNQKKKCQSYLTSFSNLAKFLPSFRRRFAQFVPLPLYQDRVFMKTECIFVCAFLCLICLFGDEQKRMEVELKTKEARFRLGRRTGWLQEVYDNSAGLHVFSICRSGTGEESEYGAWGACEQRYAEPDGFGTLTLGRFALGQGRWEEITIE